MNDRDRVYLNNILDCIHRIDAYISNMDEQEFFAHSMAKDAIVRNFEIIGEATKLLSADLRDEHKQVSWKKMAGMRDKLIHNYMGVDYRIVWQTVNDILPVLEEQIVDILQKDDRS